MKRFLPYILIIAMILSGVSLHFLSAPKQAEANPLIILGVPLINWILAGVLVAGTTGAILYFDGPQLFDATLGKILSWISGAIFSIASVFLSISGYILDYAVIKTVSGEFFNISAIGTGWAVSRDVANLFFIFILLYIAIATILQLSSYGMKALLTRLIIIALLVNFSLVITKMIIDASNVLAREFYLQLKVETIATADAPPGTKDYNGNPVSFKKGDKIIDNSPSMVFMNAIKMQTIFTPDKFKTLAPGAGEEQKDDLNNFKITMIYLGGTIVVLVTTFVFFAMAILLVIRVVVLILLMILAPLAFLFMVLPKTKSYADQWWDALLKQSFFAPTLMFLVYLSASIISDPKFAQITGSEGAAFADALSGNPSGFGIIFSFIIIIALMIACLFVAQQMGAVGAGMAMGWGKSINKAAKGYAGRVGKRYAGRVMAAAEKGLEGEGRVAGALRKVPFLQRGLAAGAQLKRKEIGAYEKQYAGYDIETLKQLEGKPGTTKEALVAMKTIRKRKEAKKANIEKENERYDQIVGNAEKGIKGDLPEAKKTYDADKQEKIRLEVEIKASEMKLQKDPDDEKVKYELVIKMQKKGEVEERIKNVDKLEEEKRKIEENRERRREFEVLEERVAKAEAAATEKGAPKPPPPTPAKT